MKNLIEITYQEGRQAVSGRELHSLLEVQTRFNDWIKARINDFQFIEGQDFDSFTQNTVKPQGGRPAQDYALTLDMAKELAMLEKSPKGREVRKYFIEAEKQLRESGLGFDVELQKRALTQQKAQLKQKLKIVESELKAINSLPVQCPKCKRICKNQQAFYAHKCFPDQGKLFA